MSVRLIGADGVDLVSIVTTLTSDLDQSVLPGRPMGEWGVGAKP